MNDIEKAIEVQKKLIEKWESRAKELEKTINKYPWGKEGLQYDFEDWRESELKRRKEQINIALITISALEKQIPKKPTEHYNWCDLTTDDFRWYCKNCDNNLDETEKHCPNCGQCLDWEVENE